LNNWCLVFGVWLTYKTAKHETPNTKNMNYIFAQVSQSCNFYGHTNPLELAEKYGTPLYVYNEAILRQRCRDLKTLLTYPRFAVQYSMKANSNLALLKIVRNEGIYVDTMSPGEIYIAQQAGFTPEQMLYVSNNVSAEEMQFAIDRNILVSVDSVSQLEQYGRLNPGGAVAIRFNPGVGAGHHEKVVTAGKKTKFGVERTFISEVKALLARYNLRLVGINHHIGSLFLEKTPYIEAAQSLLSIAQEFDDLEFVDFGGGFGIPYHKQDGQARLDLQALGASLDETLYAWVKDYGKEITFKIEPGRYIVVESGILLGTVHAVKHNYDLKYVGTDLGFNVLKRPVMYDAYHDLEVYRRGDRPSHVQDVVTVVGNICETGDILAKQRTLPEIFEGDVLGVLDAGAYGFSMCSNYNSRLRPAELLLTNDGRDVVIRRRDSLEELTRNFV
jgi:diaminopimelate decarboxylase